MSSPSPTNPNPNLIKLLSMGFSNELASQALAATASSPSLDSAANWILSQSPPPPPPNPSSQSNLRHFLIPKSPSSSSSLSPLSDRMRPSSLSLILGQDHLLPLFHSICSTGNPIPSLLLWGPPGSGKTTLARTIATSIPSHHFTPLSAVTATISDLRRSIDQSRSRRRSSRTILFIDEIHRFSKPQQDALLPAIEDGSIIFLAATTENPSFHLTTPLLSRLRILSLNPLLPLHIRSLLLRAVADAARGLPLSVAGKPISVNNDALDFISLHCDGDARVALNSLETAAFLAANRISGEPIAVTTSDAKEAMQCKHLSYDRNGDEHYNLISALHKSMRGGDADAAVYWLARMLEGGEQPLYVARRLVRFAGEDVGLADPAAVGHAVACYEACKFVGMPECDVCLAQCVVYLALAPKSVAVYKALGAARAAVRESEGGNEGVPMHLRNAPTKMMKEMGYGNGYLYPPDQEEGCEQQSYLPESLKGRKFLQWPPLDVKSS